MKSKALTLSHFDSRQYLPNIYELIKIKHFPCNSIVQYHQIQRMKFHPDLHHNRHHQCKTTSVNGAEC